MGKRQQVRSNGGGGGSATIVEVPVTPPPALIKKPSKKQRHDKKKVEIERKIRGTGARLRKLRSNIKAASNSSSHNLQPLGRYRILVQSVINGTHQKSVNMSKSALALLRDRLNSETMGILNLVSDLSRDVGGRTGISRDDMAFALSVSNRRQRQPLASLHPYVVRMPAKRTKAASD